MWKICVFHEKRVKRSLCRKLFCRGAFLQSFSGLLPGFPGGTAIDLSKEFVKKFIIGKTVSIYDFHNRILCRNQIMVNMGYPHLVYMTGKVDSHLLLSSTYKRTSWSRS